MKCFPNRLHKYNIEEFVRVWGTLSHGGDWVE